MGCYCIIFRLIVSAHTGLGIANGIVDGIIHTALGYLLGILASDALNLSHGCSLLHKAGSNLRFGGTRLLLLNSHLENLLVSKTLCLTYTSKDKRT